jgi:ABC-2 type transport system permease protein
MTAVAAAPASSLTPSPVPVEDRRRRGPMTVYRWELEKLTAQWRVRIAVLIALAGPFLATLVLRSQQQSPSDTLFGRWAHVSGAAIPLLILTFVTQYAVPLLTGLVAGDIFASEDHYGTWKLILTRGPGRAAVFGGKALAAGTYTLVVLMILALSSTVAGLLIVGRQPLVGLSGQLIPAGRASELALLSWATAVPPALGFTALGLLFSILTRNGPAGIIAPVVLGGLMEVYSLVGSTAAIRMLLLSTPYDAWHGFLSGQPHYRPLWHGVLISAGYVAVCLSAAYLRFRRRDFNEG